MKLNIKRGFFKSLITDNDKNTLFIIKSKSILSTEKVICHTDGTPVYSIRKDPMPLDRRDKYIFTEHTTQNEFYAWVDISSNRKSVPFYKRLLSVPFEIHIEAESFFGELLIKRSSVSKFDIYINGRKSGSVSRKHISCDDIDDAGLLSVLYLFTEYIARSENLTRAASSK